jgi:hypothetical protein
MRFEPKLTALRMRRDLLVGLEEAARLENLPIDPYSADETISPGLAERFAAIFAESERRLASASEPTLPEPGVQAEASSQPSLAPVSAWVWSAPGGRRANINFCALSSMPGSA